MKSVIQLEEACLFLFGIFLFAMLDFQWWLFPLLILTPDISMIGYLINTKIGAIIYNIVHHRGLSVLLFIIGFYLGDQIVQLIAVILFAHSSMDRIFGFGLKYFDSFKNTHLGKIG
jgi:hypothetical protein